MELLTTSSITKAKFCLRAYYYSHELKLRATSESLALTWGSGLHDGLKAWRTERTMDAALLAILPACNGMDPYEAVKLQATMAAYCRHYDGDDTVFTHVEQQFDLPLTNPETNGVSRTYRKAGKIDAIDDRPRVWESKSTKESVKPDSEYWMRLRLDPQITYYTQACRDMGIDITGIVYDVVRKPQQRVSQVATLDSAGMKIVIDANGDRVFNKDGKPRQSPDANQGYTVVGRDETPDEYGERIYADMVAEPESYFGRREVARCDDELAESEAETWGMSQLLLHCKRTGCWSRNPSRFTCTWCEFNSLCYQGAKVDPDTVPTGFVRLSNPNPELEES